MLIAYLGNGWSSSVERDEGRAEELLRDALEHDPNDAQARKILGILRRVQGRLTEAQIELQTSIAVDPNDTFSLRNLGSTLVQMGRPEAAIPYIEKSIHLSPHDPFIAPNYSWLGMCEVLLGHPDRAIEFLKKAWTANPRHASYRLWLAGALGLKGDLNDATAAIAEARKLSPEVDTIERFRASTPYAADPAYWALREKTVEAGLRRAGFPER